ncbi:MAG: hypothetical protein GY719_33575 [bacterium]|nr:hypothetical protein [bacterium]
MRLEAVLETARDDRLYPSVILYGSNLDRRRSAAVELARVLLCERSPELRPCGECRHCSRVGSPAESFHPDFHVLERDLRTSTSAGATKSFLKNAYAAPFEARGQVFVLAEAETLTGGAADALLKLLEEPPESSPRHFMLLAGSRLDLLTTLRSRSLAVYLGPADAFDESDVAALSEAFGRSIDGFLANPSAIHLLTAAEALGRGSGWEDPRARKPWATASAAIVHYLEGVTLDAPIRRALLALAEELLDAPLMRVRGITHGRILEGLVSRHLASPT